MKFFIAEQNIGPEATREQADKVIEMLKARGWDVEYGMGNNTPTDISEFDQEEELFGSFADDFMACIDQLGI